MECSKSHLFVKQLLKIKLSLLAIDSCYFAYLNKHFFFLK